jgi:hypothetical protein
MKMTILKLVVVVAVSCSALLGCGRESAKIETHPTPNGQWSPPVSSITLDDLKGLTGLQPTNGTLQEIVIWTNAANTKALGITRDGGIWFRMKLE